MDISQHYCFIHCLLIFDPLQHLICNERENVCFFIFFAEDLTNFLESNISPITGILSAGGFSPCSRVR